MKTRALLVPLLLLALAPRARADEASVRRFAGAVSTIDAAEEKVPALLLAIQRLEGLRLDRADVPALRAALEGGGVLAPLVEQLRSLRVEGGHVRLLLEGPVTITPKKGALSLAAETTFRSRVGPHGDVTLDDIRGIRAGKTPSLMADVRRLRVETQGERRVGRAEVSFGPLRRTLTFDAGPAPTSLARAVGDPS